MRKLQKHLGKGLLPLIGGTDFLQWPWTNNKRERGEAHFVFFGLSDSCGVAVDMLIWCMVCLAQNRQLSSQSWTTDQLLQGNSRDSNAQAVLRFILYTNTHPSSFEISYGFLEGTADHYFADHFSVASVRWKHHSWGSASLGAQREKVWATRGATITRGLGVRVLSLLEMVQKLEDERLGYKYQQRSSFIFQIQWTPNFPEWWRLNQLNPPKMGEQFGFWES